MSLYSAPVVSGIPALDRIVEVLLRGSAIERAGLADPITAACTQEEFSVGPPPCEPGMAEGTQVERFSYRMYREQRYTTQEEIPSLMDFEIEGVYSIYAVPAGGFESEWMPAGEYRIVLVESGTQRTIEVVVNGEGIVMIEIWELTPPEVFADFTPEYILPPLA
jgi:hypothetical protein